MRRFSSSSSWEFRAKKDFTDYRTANTIQFFLLLKEIFQVYFFSEQVVAKANSTETT